jgi:uncharacterized protein DUF3500
MSADSLPGQMRIAATSLLAGLDDEQRALAARLADADLHFAWEGPLTPGARHYYRVQADDVLIEYEQ